MLNISTDFLFPKPKYNVVDADEFRQRLHEKNNVRLLDVSSEEDYFQLHIPGAAHLDFSRPSCVALLQTWDKSRTYFIYCRNGNRVYDALARMKEMGFKNIYALKNGLHGWKGTLEMTY